MIRTTDALGMNPNISITLSSNGINETVTTVGGYAKFQAEVITPSV